MAIEESGPFEVHLVVFGDPEEGTFDPTCAYATKPEADAAIAGDADEDERAAYRVEAVDLVTPAPVDDAGDWFLGRDGWQWAVPQGDGVTLRLLRLVAFPADASMADLYDHLRSHHGANVPAEDYATGREAERWNKLHDLAHGARLFSGLADHVHPAKGA